MLQAVRLALSGLCMALAGTALAQVPADAREAGPGAAGAGDPYVPSSGNGGYDVRHYEIHDTYGLRRGRLHGWTVLRATTTEDLSSFHLDLVLATDRVSVDEQPAAYRRLGRHELEVTPAEPIPAGTTFSVRVGYHGRPGAISYDGERPFFRAPDEAVATNEPTIAPWWFPANDHPSDKATYDISVRVRKGVQAISNGRLVDRSTQAGWSTWRWRMNRPMASYLAFFVAGRFRIERGTSHGLPWLNAVSRYYDRATEDRALALLRRTPGIVRWLATQFGAYPFTTTGGVVGSLNTGFALENQSRPTYPYLGTGRRATSTVVHELAHQWFGDQVSVQRWRDIWLNEGFATWAEWRYDETHHGVGPQRRLLRTYHRYPADSWFWRLEIADPGPDRMFGIPVYDRGAMALQALRKRIGTAAFLRLMRTWVSEHADGNATVEDFEALAAEVSRADLDGFFEAWLHSRSRPAPSAANGLR